VNTAKSRLKSLAAAETHGKPQAHPGPVGPQVLERSAGDGDERHTPRREMDNGAVETVRGVRATRTTRVRPAVDGRPEHEVVDEQLRAPAEEVGQRLRPVVGLEAVVLVDGHPRQRLPLASELIAPARELLFVGQK